jgi:hypothetical protein
MNDLGVPGFWVTINPDGNLTAGSIPSDSTAYDDASLLATRTLAGAPIIVAGGYDGHVRVLETGDLDDVAADGSGGNTFTARVRDRPVVFNAVRHTKRARKVRALVTTPTTTSLSLSVVGDGTESASVAATVMGGAIAYGAVPQTAHGHVNNRGRVIQSVVRATQAGLRISGITTEAGILNGRH